MEGSNGTPAEPGKGEARPGRLRVIILLAVGFAALMIAIAGIATREPGNDYTRVEGVNDGQRIFGGVRQLGDRLGEEDAPVQIQVFTDVQSVVGAEDFVEVVAPIANAEARQGEVRMLLRNRSLTRNATQLSFFGIEAATEQDAGWNFAWLMTQNLDLAEQEGIDEEFLELLAEAIERVELPIWRRDYRRGLDPESEMTRRLEDYDKVAIDLGLRAAPAMVVAGPGGTEVLQDSPDLATVRRAIDIVR